jgi:glycosyltransferase involved in cell wall biosynthesis
VRNEAANIERAVRSVAAQGGWREILVADDQSEDETPEIVRRLSAEIPGLELIRVESLPEGWLGKCHALAVGARRARGEWFLFTDADTEHRPGGLEGMLRRAEAENADLLSLSPGQRTETWWEKAVIPLVYAELAQIYRFEDVSDPNSPAAAANGQYLLIRRSAYERAGGHEAVRNEILEDVALARRVKQRGGKTIFLPGAEWVETRMYRSFGELWRGWTKNLDPLFEGRGRRASATVARLWLLEALPFAAFVSAAILFALGRGGLTATLAVFAFFVLALMRHWSYGQRLARLGFDVWLANYLAPGAVLVGLLLLNSMRAYRLNGRVEWKGRHYPTRGNR